MVTSGASLVAASMSAGLVGTASPSSTVNVATLVSALTAACSPIKERCSSHRAVLRLRRRRLAGVATGMLRQRSACTPSQ